MTSGDILGLSDIDRMLEAELNSCEHNLGDWILKDDGTRYRRCMKCKQIIIEERIPDRLRY